MKNKIIDYAINVLNIDAIGFSSPIIPQKDLENYEKYLSCRNYGDMQWMKTRKELRSNPLTLLSNAQSAIIIGMNYFGEKSPKDYKISIYANQKQDYHKWVYKKCKELSNFLTNEYEGENKFFVDSAPILEKVLAKQTNIGWQGKHTCIVSRNFGSWLFLGIILTSLKITPDKPSNNYCGTCNKCIASCPTKALSPYQLDVEKCISYLTIEHKGIIPNEIVSKMGTNIFGCDECLKACHFNKWQKISPHEQTQENEKFPQSQKDFLTLSLEEFNNIFQGTPLKRTGFTKLQENLKAIKNN